MTRRLPPDFLSVWDRWLQATQVASRLQLAGSWRDIYLSSPIWRFVLAPGLCGEQSWMGLLMPGMDKVGRYFPLTIAVSLAKGVPDPAWLQGSTLWFEQVEVLALRSLRQDFSLERFDHALSMINLCVDCVEASIPGASGCRICQLADLSQLSNGLQALGPLPVSHSLWWSEGSQRIPPCVAQCEGLPDTHAFVAMLDGQWLEQGWQNVSPVPSGT